MSLEDQISQDYISAMKAKESDKSSALSFLRAQIKNVKIDKRVEKVSDEEVVAVIKKQIKQRQDSITQFLAGGRNDLVAKEQAEIDLYQQYLPAQASPQQIKEVVEAVIKELGASSIKDMGRVMKTVLERLAGRADNQAVSQVVKESLGAL